jgi:hypothetical protein
MPMVDCSPTLLWSIFSNFHHFLKHPTQLRDRGGSMNSVGGRKKKEKNARMISHTLGTKRGGIQSQILICRKNFWKISNGAWGWGGGRCHYPHSEIAGFSQGIGCFSIVPPYDSSSQPLIRSKTHVRSFWNTIYNSKKNIGLCVAPNAQVPNIIYYH